MNFMIIRRFLIYFADFRANFFDDYFVLLAQIGIEKNPFYLSNFMIRIGYRFLGKNHFFCWEMWQKNGENWNYFS